MHKFSVIRWVLVLVSGWCISMPATAQTFVNAEYFFDNDPGIGSGTSIALALPGDNITFTTAIPTGALVQGFHNLTVRIKQNGGAWSLFESRGFYISTAVPNAANISAAEYFFDNDPGSGNGTAIAVATGATASFTVSLPAGLPSGFHFVAIRTKGTDGRWGVFESRGFYISEATTAAANITAAEYFFDNDPGAGNGLAIPVTTAAATTFTVSLPATGLAPGFHFLAIRIKGSDGKWGVFESRGFYVSGATTDAPDVVAAEYFFDTDPGVGNALSMPVPAGANPNFTVTLPSTGLTNGFHFLTIRTRGSDGKWGVFETRGFYISSETADAGTLVAAEYFFDTDPGVGSGQSLAVNVPGATINQVFDIPVPADMPEGTHTVSIRVHASDGKWSVKETGTFEVITNDAPIADAGSDQTIPFPGNSATLNGAASTDPDGTIAAYTWTKVSGPVAGTLTDATQPTTTVNNLAGGSYLFALTVTDNLGAIDKDTVQIIVGSGPNQAPVANAGPDQTIILPVNTAPLNASASFDPDGTIVTFAWKKVNSPAPGTIADAGQSAAVASNLAEGNYQFELSVTDNSGASDRDTVRVTVVDLDTTCPATPTITLNGNFLIGNPAGDSYQWYKNGIAVGEAITQILEIDIFENGVYALEVTENACTVRSDDFILIITGAETGQEGLRIYPNPVAEKFTVEAPPRFSGTSVMMLDGLGRSVLTTTLAAGVNEFKSDDLAQGIYYILIDGRLGYKLKKL